MANVKSPAAWYFCRHCMSHKDDRANMNLDCEGCARRLHSHRADIIQGRQIAAVGEQAEFCKQKGLKLTPNPLQQLIFDETQQIPPELDHLEIKGIAGHILELFATALGEAAREELDWRLASANLWPDWPQFHPFSHLADWSHTDIKHFCLVAPTVLRGWLTDGSFTKPQYEALKANVGDMVQFDFSPIRLPIFTGCGR
jgi:hypothetical protein